jgi:hypothetical protein
MKFYRIFIKNDIEHKNSLIGNKIFPYLSYNISKLTTRLIIG